MAGSTFGNLYRVTTWGESHGKALGAVIDGCPAGVPLEEADIQALLDRRKPGQSKASTARKEADQCEILSGVFEGKTTGTPISVIVWNADQHSRDYSDLAEVYRPGHADYPYQVKYGIRDYRGGGRSSGRETIGRVIGGAVAEKILSALGIHFLTYAKAIGPVTAENVDPAYISQNPFYLPDPKAAEEAEKVLDQARKDQDSLGGIIECRVLGLPVGIGEPVFDKLDAELAKAMLSIGAVKGFEIGDGFQAARARGSENNDGFALSADKKGKPVIVKTSNHSGGTLGGMSDGDDLLFRVAVKPTPSISQAQKTVRQTAEKTEETEICIHGRHDPIIVPRAVVVVESMAAMTILDLYLRNCVDRMDELEKNKQE
jgi:chorismate synthase